MLTTHFIKILGAAVLTLLVLLPVGCQLGMTATNDPKTETVVDASGNLRVPGDYRAAYQSLGSWAVAATKARVQRRSTSSMHRPEQSLRTVETAILQTALCL